MASELATHVGPLGLRSPLVAASGTVGSVWEWAAVADVTPYGAAVAKSVSPDPWSGRKPPRVSPLATGMLNGIGIQNPGIEVWVSEMTPIIEASEVSIWGSAVAEDIEGFAVVAKKLELAGVAAIEVNLSCPNLENGEMFSFDEMAARDVVQTVVGAVEIPVGAKLSPDTSDIVAVASACSVAGADFVVLTNTAMGLGVDPFDAMPLLSGGVGGYSGPGLKPLSLRCVYEVRRALPDMPIVGCGGVTSGMDLVEYLMVGASAVEAGTVHLAEPKAGVRIIHEFRAAMKRLGIDSPTELIGTLGQW